MPIFPLEKEYITYLVVMKNAGAMDEMACDLARELEISTSAATYLLTSYFRGSASKLAETDGVFYVNITEASKWIDEIRRVVQNISEHKIFEYVREWLDSGNCAKHIALSGIVFSGLKSMAHDKQGHLMTLSVLQDFNTAKKNSPQIHLDGGDFYDGWIDDGIETCPILDCIPIGERYVVWRLYPEKTCIPILGFIDFCRHQNYMKSLDAWLFENIEYPTAKIISQVRRIEEILLFLDSTFI